MKRPRQSTLATIALTMAALSSSACDPHESSDLDDAALDELVETVSDEIVDHSDLEIVAEQPDLILPLKGGSQLGFTLDEDGSIGILEEVPKGANVASVLDDPWLRDASPAVIWYALTTEGVEIPEPLRVHHENLAAIGELAPLEEALAGQLRDLAPVPLADETSPCLNATFDTNHCDHPDYDESMCLFNTSGNWAWNTYGTDRYKAGFCLQEGTARSWLYYWPGAAPVDGECVYFRFNTFVWGAGSYANGDRYSAETYLTYVWWRGANAAHRAYFHRAIADSGAVLDFGNRYSTESCG